MSRGINRTIVGVVGDEAVLDHLEGVDVATPGCLGGAADHLAVQAGQPGEPHPASTVSGSAACRSARTPSPSSPDPCAVETPSRRWPRPSWPVAPARRCCAAAPTSRAPRRTPSRGSASTGCASWPRSATRSGCRSSPRWSTPPTSDVVAGYADMLQVGTRNMQNFALLQAVGESRQAGDAQARSHRDLRGMADGRRVHRAARQPRHRPVRAGHPHVRDRDPQHARRLRGPDGAARCPTCR